MPSIVLGAGDALCEGPVPVFKKLTVSGEGGQVNRWLQNILVSAVIMVGQAEAREIGWEGHPAQLALLVVLVRGVSWRK